MTLLERNRITYLGYTIGQSLFSNRWIIRRGWTHVAYAPSAFDAVELCRCSVDPGKGDPNHFQTLDRTEKVT